MKKVSLLLFMVSVLALNTFAQSSETPSQRGLSLSVGAIGGIPVGTFKSESKFKFGVGGNAQLALPLSKALDGTISAGYMGFSQSKLDAAVDGKTFILVPFQAGIRYLTPVGFYVHPKVGFTQTKYGGEEGSGELSYAFTLGYLINKTIDISAGYEALGSGKDQVIQSGTTSITVPGVTAKFIGLRVAYNFNFARAK